MVTSLAELRGVEETRINVQVTSTDRMGSIGRGEGIAGLAVVLLEPIDEPGRG
jgi:2C-methyl-D-erythritol 2,4-cyclodiphosphate synthase